MALMRRLFTSKVTQESEKIVIVGIDFGTSFTKVYFNQGGDIKQPLKFNVQGESTYFIPTQLYYNQNLNQVFFEYAPGRETLKYFKYSMINKDLVTSETLTRNNQSVLSKPEFLCSIFYIASLIREVKKQISEILKTSNIKYSFNMGCPIDNYGEKNKGIYDTVLKLGYQLSLNGFEDGMTINALHDFYEQNKNCSFSNLQTIPELYAEALWFIEQPSTGEGIYTILDVGGGTVDFASILVRRTEEGEKQTTIYSQNVMALGVEVLLQFMYPQVYKTQREVCIKELKNKSVKMPYGWKPEYNQKRELKKAHEFDVKFAEGIAEVKERNRHLMDEQYKKNILPYYSFGGGADFRWYHSVIESHNTLFDKANIPPLKKQPVILNGILDNRLIIAEQLTRSNFPEIEGFPWEFSREKIFSGMDRTGDDLYISSSISFDDYKYELEERQKEIYGD